MRLLLMICLAGVVGAAALARGLENLAVRRAAANEMLAIAAGVCVMPMLAVPMPYGSKHQVTRHLNAFTQEMNNAFSEHTDLLHNYVELLHEREVDIDSLVAEFYAVLEQSAASHVAGQKDTALGKFKWFWLDSATATGTAKFDDEIRKNILRDELQDTVRVQEAIRLRGGDGNYMTDVYDILQERMDNDDRQLIEDRRVFYTEFPQLNLPLLSTDIAQARKMLAETKLSFHAIMDKLQLEMLKSITKDDGIALPQRIHLVDVFRRSTLIKMIKKYYELGDTVHSNSPDSFKYYAELNIVDLRNSVVLNLIDMPKEWDVTWEQLRDKRTFIAVVGEFIQTLALDWHEFGRLVYPQDKRAAARLITNITGSEIDLKTMINALQVYRLQDDALLTHSDLVLATLPYLFEKNIFSGDLAVLAQKNMLTEDEQAYAELEGNSPRGILDAVLDQEIVDTGRWQYLNSKQIIAHQEWYTPALALATILEDSGLARDIISEQIFTAPLFDKLQRGVALNAPDIVMVRQLVSAENITNLLQPLAMADKERVAITQSIQFLPLILQLENLVRTLAEQLRAEDTFLQALERIVETDSMFVPLALTMQELHEPQATASKTSKRKRKKHVTASPLMKLRSALVNVANKTESARQKYIAALAEPQASEKSLAIRHDKASHEWQQRQAQLRADRQAQKELERKIFILAKNIGKEDLPLETPLWLRLRALLIYMDADAQQLAQRAAMKGVGEKRFAALLATNATTLPAKAELDSIAEALTKHTLGRDKQTPTSKAKRIRLENMEVEIEAMHTLLSFFEK